MVTVQWCGKIIVSLSNDFLITTFDATLFDLAA